MTFALWAAGLGVGGAALAVLWVVARQTLARWGDGRLVAQAVRVRALLVESREREFEGLDKMLFDMRDVYDPHVIEDELREQLRGSSTRAPNLVQAFSVLGITDRNLDAVRTARSWQQRALAATTLGALGELRAIKPLVEALHDAREDADVKLACAEALGQIRDPAVVPLLIDELENVDEWSSPRLAAVLAAFGEVAVEPLLTAVASAPSLNVRMWSVQVLGKIGDRRAVAPLLARMNDRADALRMSVANALGDLRDGRAVRPLIDAVLRDPSPTVRAQAVAALGRIGDASCLPLLVGALGDLEHWVRLRALEAIEATAPSDTSAIEAALADQNRDVRHRAALALERLGALEQSFSDLDNDDEQRAHAARDRLIAVGRAGLSERLTRHLEDPAPRIRARVIAVLGEIGDPAHAAGLIARLDDDDVSVRLAAIEALGTIGGRGAASALVAVLRDGPPQERDAATAALLRHPPTELAAIDSSLTSLASHERDEVRAATVKILAVLPGKAIDTQLLAALSDRFGETRLAAVRALGSRRVVEAVDEIGTSLSASTDELRIAAAHALGSIGGPRAVQLLVAALALASGEFRDAVCAALAGFGWDAAYPTFDVLLASDNLAARLGVVWTLGKTADPRAVPILHMLLHEPEGQVRSAAAGALGKIADPRVVGALVEVLADPSPFVRAAAVNALGGRNQAHTEVIAPLLEDPDSFVRNRAAVTLGLIGGVNADTVLANHRAGNIPTAYLVMGRGLTGTEAGVAAALRAMADATTCRDLNRLLAEEAAVLRQRFFASLNVEDDAAKVEIDFDVVIARYIEILRNSSDVDARRRAANAIGDLSDERAITALASAVRQDPDLEVRCNAATRLAGRPEGNARAALLGAVHDPQPRVRLAAIRAVGNTLTPRDAGPLFGALASPDPEVVAAAEQALAAIHASPDSLAVVQDWMMAQESEALVSAGLRILARIADSRSLRAIQELARSGASAVRVEACRALAALSVPEAIRTMLGALDDPVAAVRVAVVQSLQRATRADVIDRLGLAASDPSAEVRAAVCDTLTTLETTQSAPVLARLVGDHDVSVSAKAVLGLLSLSDVEGLARVPAVWSTITPEARRRVKDAMGDAIARLETMIATALEAELRETAVRILATIDATAHAERIAHALEDPDGRVRLAAVHALVGLEPARVGDWLERVSNDPVAEIRVAARRGPWKLV